MILGYVQELKEIVYIAVLLGNKRTTKMTAGPPTMTSKFKTRPTKAEAMAQFVSRFKKKKMNNSSTVINTII